MAAWMYALFLVSALLYLESECAQAEEQNSLAALQQRVRLLDRKLARFNRRLRKLEGSSNGNDNRGRFADDPPCPDKTDGFNFSKTTGSCYHLEPSTVMTNWSQAKFICQRLSPKAHLVSIETAEEQAFLVSRWLDEIGIATFGRFWTSGRKFGKTWKWSASNRPMRYTNWMPLIPQNDDDFQCTAVYSSEAYTWSGVACWAPHLVTCEINL